MLTTRPIGSGTSLASLAIAGTIGGVLEVLACRSARIAYDAKSLRAVVLCRGSRSEAARADRRRGSLPPDFRYRITRVSLQAEANVAPKFVSVHVTRVGDGYLSTMGIPLLRGRGFTVDDRAGAEMVTVISKPLADQLFPNTDAAEAIGKRLTLGADEKTQQTPRANPRSFCGG
jgi:hypothetical protein